MECKCNHVGVHIVCACGKIDACITCVSACERREQNGRKDRSTKGSRTI